LGELVYVNYGRVEDIEELKRLDVSLIGTEHLEDIEKLNRMEVNPTVTR